LKYNSHISVWFPWYIWVLTWISKNWISLSNHTAYSKNKWDFWIPSWLLYRKVLINSKNIDEAKNILETEKRTIANNLMIWDYKNNTWILSEFDNKNIAYRDFDKKEILVSTNHFRTEKMKKVSINKEGSRYKQYFEKMWELEKVKVSDLIGILSHYKKTKYWETIANNWTIQSVIIIPELKKIFVANGENIPVTNGEFVEIEYEFKN
jgi:predicted choloylglycine hydrolase